MKPCEGVLVELGAERDLQLLDAGKILEHFLEGFVAEAVVQQLE